MTLNLHPHILESICSALTEDIGAGDATSISIIPADAAMRGHIIAKQDGIVAGLEVAQAVYEAVDPDVEFQPQVEDGAHVSPGKVLALVSGRARSLLAGERTALNFLGRMSGIATLTHQFVKAVAGTKAVILDTRKTAPGLRLTDKMAVKYGGGQNHRIGMYDMILVKDNHIDFAGSISEAVNRVRAANTGLVVEVEARSLDDVREALKLGVERILLDNMPPSMLKKAVKMRDEFSRGNESKPLLEASGNVSLETVRGIAKTGVDFISSGALTHSVRVFDMSFEYLDHGV